MNIAYSLLIIRQVNKFITLIHITVYLIDKY